MALRIHQFIPLTHVEGPGPRAMLQVQGCPIHCPGCAVPFTWPKDGGYSVEVPELAAQIARGPAIEGITFLGGEPFAQAAELARLAGILRAEGLSVVTFTGYVLEQLQAAGREDQLALLAATDLLIDGPFQQARLDTSRPWIGSANQRYHFLTDRYRHLADELSAIPNRLEVRITPDGKVSVNGLAGKQDLDHLFRSLL